MQVQLEQMKRRSIAEEIATAIANIAGHIGSNAARNAKTAVNNAATAF